MLEEDSCLLFKNFSKIAVCIKRQKYLLFIDIHYIISANELRVDITPNVEVMHAIVGDCVRLRCEASKSANLSWTRLEANMRYQ